MDFDAEEFEKSLESYHTGWDDIADPVAEIRRMRAENEGYEFPQEGGAS